MIYIKTSSEIAVMKRAGHLLAETLFATIDQIKPGITELELDKFAEKMILERGGKESFKYVPNWKHTICISPNEVVVHGIPTKRKLKEGDIIGIDCGVCIDGWHSDMSETVYVGNKEKMSEEIKKFLEVGKSTLNKAIEQVRPNNRIGDISLAIQKNIESAGYSVVRAFIGHGLGESLHEDPEIPGFLDKKIKDTPLLHEGMTLAIEVIYTKGNYDVIYANNDGWTIKTIDGSLSGLFERTVVVTKDGVEILTKV